ncbi:MAG TPA: DUF4070 domain-containing protein, partial [Blastocatellia bacterium]|nr:DUF4070 domain-containing protein [Blastocatellia bacterium]
SAIPLAMVGLLNALPDTQLWRRLKSEGRLVAESNGDNTSYSLNFAPKMNPARLIAGYRSLMQTIYNPGQYYQRALECLKRVPEQESPQRYGGIGYRVAALMRILLRLGIRDRARREFWRFLWRVATQKREKLEEALRLAAMGYHCRKLTEAGSD